MRAVSRWGRVVVAGVAVAGLFGVDALAGAVPVAAAVTVPAAAAAPAVAEAADLVSARVAARAQGARVEAVSERSEFTTTWANPDGTLTTDASTAPVRFKDASAPAAQGTSGARWT